MEAGVGGGQLKPLAPHCLEVGELGLEPQIIRIPNAHDFNDRIALPALLYCPVVYFPPWALCFDFYSHMACVIKKS